MEAEGSKPLKVCRHCSVASRTDAATCPSCGRPYERHIWPWGWRWWFAIPIVVLAFAVGYFGISKLIEDDDPPGVTAQDAGAVEPGVTQAELEDELGEPPQYERQKGVGVLLPPRRAGLVHGARWRTASGRSARGARSVGPRRAPTCSRPRRLHAHWRGALTRLVMIWVVRGMVLQAPGEPLRNESLAPPEPAARQILITV